MCKCHAYMSYVYIVNISLFARTIDYMTLFDMLRMLSFKMSNNMKHWINACFDVVVFYVVYYHVACKMICFICVLLSC